MCRVQSPTFAPAVISTSPAACWPRGLDKPALLDEIVRWADRDKLVPAFYNLADDDLPLVRAAAFK